MDLCRFPRGYGPVRPVAMEGLVIAMTRVTKYTQGARFLCQNDDCPCSTGTNFANVFALICKVIHAYLGCPMQSYFFMPSLGTCKHFPFFVHLNTLGFHHIRVHTPGATESATVGNNLSCMVCSSPLKEDVKFRVLGGEMDVYSMSDEMHCSVI